ncbi:MAG: ATP-binding protein [Methanomicrobium sp.]|nr:ATP-binding protein [Methanomicrobium sp.]
MPDIERVEIYADQLLQTVLYNIFENAVRHGGNITEIKVSFHEKDGKGILVIEDNGKGVSGDLKGKIFERGVGSNTGPGLFLAKEILDITDISISETGEEGKGTRFEILVPPSGFRFKT